MGLGQSTLEGMEVKVGFWEGKKVFITGHTGFKGSWLSLWLQQQGAQVTGYSLEPPSEPNLFTVATVAEGMESLTGDIRNLDGLTEAMRRSKPEAVVHMAAQSLVRQSYSEPVESYATNIMGTVNVLEAVRQTGTARVVLVVTSDKCYENREWPWGYREYEPMGGHDPYSSSKGCAELVTAAYRRSFFGSDVAVASARAGNVIGGGDWAEDRLIPDIIRAFLRGEPVRIRNPMAVRPWQHVLDPLHGYLVLLERLWERSSEFAEGWNFGPDDADSRPVAEVANALTERWGNGVEWVVDVNDHPHEAGVLKLDCSKAHKRLGWRPVLDLSVALEWVVEWYQAFGNGADVRQLSLDQIARFESKAEHMA